MCKHSWVFSPALVLGLASSLFAQNANTPSPTSLLRPGIQLRSAQRELPANPIGLSIEARGKTANTLQATNRLGEAGQPAPFSRSDFSKGSNKVDLRLPVTPSRRSLDATEATNQVPAGTGPIAFPSRRLSGDR